MDSLSCSNIFSTFVKNNLPAVFANQTFNHWYRKSVHSCLNNSEDKECNLKTGDIYEGQIVS